MNQIHLSRNSKLMLLGVVLSLVVLVCSGAMGCPIIQAIECGKTKQDRFPGFWVSCVENHAVLMAYEGDIARIVSITTQGNFNPADYDCSHPFSPAYKNSSKPLFKTSGTFGPASGANSGHAPQAIQRAAAASSIAYLRPLLRDLPFLPPVPAAATTQCDPSLPDIFQTIHTNAQVTRFSMCPPQIKARIPVTSRPLQMDITPDGSTALVTSFDNAVTFIDLATNKVVFTLQTASDVNPNGLAISPDGKTAYIISYSRFNPVVQQIDIATRKITATFSTTFPWPQSVTFSPDGSQIWVNTDNLDAGVNVFDTLTNTLVASLNISAPGDIAFNSKGTVAYITTPGFVRAMDTATFQTIKIYPVGISPADIAMSYGDQFLVVNNSDGTISVIDLVTQKVSSVQIGSGPVSGIAFVK